MSTTVLVLSRRGVRARPVSAASKYAAFAGGVLAVCATLGLAAMSSGCADEQLGALRPEIRIVDADDATRSLCAVDFVRDCRVDLGDVAAGRSALFTFLIENPGPVALAVRGVAIEGSPHVAIEGDAPSTVLAGASAPITVRVEHAGEGPLAARVVIESDAANVEEPVVIEVTANGVAAGVPEIVVEPAACDFGAVAPGVRALCTLSIANNGTEALRVDDASLADDAPAAFAVETPLAQGTQVPAGTAVTLTVSATPAGIGALSSALYISSNDAARPTVSVPLAITGAQEPTAVARVKSVNGAAFAGTSVEPLDDVVLSGDQSVAGIVGYAWEIVEKPAESSVVLSAPASVDTGFVFSSAAGDVQGLDVAGTFRVRLTVTDASGASSTNDATVTLNAVPTGGVHVQLSWSESSNDIDLHLGRGFNVDWCSNDDCYYGNCEGFGPNWDGVPGRAGDPVLDIDDTNGFGPENINIEEPVDNSYIIGVHTYSGEGGAPGFVATDVRIKVFIDGALTATFDRHIQNVDRFWRVARVEVNGGAVSVNEVDTVGNTPGGCE